jgi:3-phenylpropionate/trans-cinnamate dioxygenase ferredoxin subunit
MADAKKFEVVCKVADIEVGKYMEFEVNKRPVLICNVENEIYAIENRCSHATSPLCGGKMRRGSIICPLHGARFSVKTGAVEGPPAFEPIDTFVVQIDNGDIAVAVPEKKNAPAGFNTGFMPPAI